MVSIAPGGFFGDLLLPPVAVAVTRSLVLTEPPREAEVHHVAGTVWKRRMEFLVGRECAHRALKRIGREMTSLDVGNNGSPGWPAGVVGSITHCTGLVAAAAAPVSGVAHLGIDAEPARRLPEGVCNMVSASEEQEAARDRLGSAMPWDLLLFCAKEAAYKAIYPTAQRWIGFEEAWVALHDHRLLSIHFDAPDLPAVLEGAWTLQDGLVLVAVAPRDVLNQPGRSS